LNEWYINMLVNIVKMLATDRTKPNQYVIYVEILKCLYRPSGQDNNLIQDILLRTKDNEAA